MHSLNTSPQLKCLFMNQHVAKRTKGLSHLLWLCSLYAPLKQTRPRFITSSNLHSAAHFLCKNWCPGLVLHLSAFEKDFVLLTHLQLSGPLYNVFHIRPIPPLTLLSLFTPGKQIDGNILQVRGHSKLTFQCFSLQTGQFCFLLQACGLNFKDGVRFRRAFDACDGMNDTLRGKKRPQWVWRSLRPYLYCKGI